MAIKASRPEGRGLAGVLKKLGSLAFSDWSGLLIYGKGST